MSEENEPQEGGSVASVEDTGTQSIPESDLSEAALPEDQDTFDRGYVEKLRGEAAKYRTKAREAEDYRKSFGPEADWETWRQLASTLYQDQAAGVRWMRQIAEGLEAGMTDSQAVEAAGPEPTSQEAPPESKGLSIDDLERWATDRENKAAVQREVSKIEDKVKALGYELGTDQHVALLHLAANTTGGDLDKAHEILTSREQEVIDRYLAMKAKETGSTSPGSIGVVPNHSQEIKSLDDAERAMRQYLKDIKTGAGGF